MYRKGLLYSLLALGTCLFYPREATASSDKKPNVILIYADDLGKGLLSVYGQKQFTTPNIDALIKNGVDFSYAYGGAVCSYARASLFTGYHNCTQGKWRITSGGAYIKDKTENIPSSENFIEGNTIYLPEADLYLPQVFKNAGYVTGQIGKLGIGNTSTRTQMVRYGWDYFYGDLDFDRSKGYYPPFLFENETFVTIEGNTKTNCGVNEEQESEFAYSKRWNMEGKEVYAPDLFIEKTIEFLTTFKGSPFFLMFSPQLPHGPVSVQAIHPEVANNDALTPIEKEYATMVKLLDEQVGKIMAELRSLGLEENTIVIFTSDNGHENHYIQPERFERPPRNIYTKEYFDESYSKYYSEIGGDIFDGNAGMAGLKRNNLEGGIHVPLAFYWKGHLKSGVCNEVVANYDFLPTIAEMLNVSIKTKKSGASFLQSLMKGKKLSKNHFVIVGSYFGPALIMNDGWKLRYSNRKKNYELYNLREDPKEKYDVSLRFPKKTEDLKKIMLEQCNGSIENGIHN